MGKPRLPFRLRRTLPAAIAGLAAACFLLAALLPARAPILREAVFVLDASASADPAAAGEKIAVIARRADRAALVEVAGRARLRDDWRPGAPPPPPGPDLEREATDLAAALEFASALPRAGRTRRRVILLSDGRETRGNAVASAGAVREAARIDAVALGRKPAGDARLLRLSGPSQAEPGSAIELLAELEAESPVALAVELRDETGRILDRREAEAIPAGGTVRLRSGPLTPGLRRLEARIARTDAVPENDAAAVLVSVRRGGPVLWVGQDPPAWAAALPLEVLPAALDPARLAACRALVLRDVPADALPPGLSARLGEAVDGGLGLLVVGGFSSLGPGGYGDGSPPLEALLPVRVAPGGDLAAVFALDISGSMSAPEAGGGPTRLALAASALLAARARLAPGDRTGAVVFSDRPLGLEPLGQIEESDDAGAALLAGRLAELHAGGGTRLFAGLEAALDLVRGAPARRRLVAVVTDGDAAETGEELERALGRLAARLREESVALVLFAIGDAPAETVLSRLEKEAGARVLRIRGRRAQLPGLLAAEIASARPWRRDDLLLARVAPHPVVAAAAPLPPGVRAAVAVGPVRVRAGAEALLEAGTGETLAASWRRGAGRVLVLAGAPWQEWGWPEEAAKALTLAALGWCAGPPEDGEARATDDGRTITVSCAPRTEARWAGPLKARIARAEGAAAEEFDLTPAQGGFWSGTAPSPGPGLCRIEIFPPAGGAPLATTFCETDSAVEWRLFGADGAHLERIALAGGGALLTGAEGEEEAAWASTPVGGHAPDPAAPGFLLSAGIVLLLGALALAWRD